MDNRPNLWIIIAQQGQIIPNTIQSSLSAVNSYHIDHNLPVDAFTSPRIDSILSGACSLFPHTKKERLPITKEIFEKIKAIPPKFHRRTEHRHSFQSGMGWFSAHGRNHLRNMFVNTSLTGSDVTTAENYQHAIMSTFKAEQNRSQQNRGRDQSCSDTR